MKRTIYIKSRDYYPHIISHFIPLYAFADYFTIMEIKGHYTGIDIPRLHSFSISLKQPLENGYYDVMRYQVYMKNGSCHFAFIDRKICRTKYSNSPFWFPWLFPYIRFLKVEYDMSHIENAEKYLSIYSKSWHLSIYSIV